MKKWIKRPRQVAPLQGLVDYIAAAIASCGVGFVSTASGTFASLCAVVAWLPLSQLPLATRLEAIAIVSVIGVWAAGRMERCWGKDPSQTVIDEVAGQWITLLFIPRTPFAFAIGFFLFRMFDILKPNPIRKLEKLPGGWGVMADDWLAGIFGAVVFAILQFFHLFEWNF